MKGIRPPMKPSYYSSLILLQQNPHHHMAGNMEYRNSVKIRLWTWNIGTLNGKRLEICDELWRGNVDEICDELWRGNVDEICNELWKRNVDLCCIQDVRWRGCGARLICLQGRRYK